ncbi:transposase [Rhizobium skierniewicense]|nr:transposase [Rhizobium skierniewicense]
MIERGLTWAVGIPKHQKPYPDNVGLIFPVSGHGRSRKHSIPDTLSVAAETMLASASWKKASWRRGTKGRLTARFAALRIRIADGTPQRIHDKGQQHMPGEAAWLVSEWRSNDERKYYLSNLPVDATLKVLAAAIKARWVCEQAHQQTKEELGFDPLEGRSWQGLHRHALMTMIAYAFLQHQKLQTAKWEKKKQRVRRGPPKPTLPAARPSSRDQCACYTDSTNPMSVLLIALSKQKFNSAKVVLGPVDKVRQPYFGGRQGEKCRKGLLLSS